MGVQDPWIERTKLRQVLDTLVIAVCAIICCLDTGVEVESAGHTNGKRLEIFLELPNDIPSHNTCGRASALLDPDPFRNCFSCWIAELSEITLGR